MEQTVEERLAALEQWHAAGEAEAEGAGHGSAREARRDAQTRHELLDRQREALRAQAAARTAEPPAEGPRAVLVHRLDWTRRALAEGLTAAGVQVAAQHADGAAGLGAAVAEQPDLVVVQQQLPWLGGLEVVRAVRALCPGVRIAVHLDQPGAEAGALAAGADAVLPRSTPPAQVVQRLRALAGIPAEAGGLHRTSLP